MIFDMIILYNNGMGTINIPFFFVITRVKIGLNNLKKEKV